MKVRTVVGTIAKIMSVVLLLALVAGVTIYILYVRVADPQGYYQRDPLATGTPTPVVASGKQLAKRLRARDAGRPIDGAATGKQILFGDTHVHTTWSFDAFMFSLPMMNASKGAYPPAAACDYSRFVAQLDFYFLTDHAESYTAERWRDAQESVRACNAVAGNGNDPDMVAFIGFEWSQYGITAADHFGHHNVLFRDTEPGSLPARAIGASGPASHALRGRNYGENTVRMLQRLDMSNGSYYQAFGTLLNELRTEPDCPGGIDSRELPTDCYESAANPGELFAKLDQWGFDTLVIPHGSAWGIYTPPGASWEHQLTAKYHDPTKSRLIEVYSGHGNSENFRDFQARAFDSAGKPYCPKPQSNYLPSCWQAGVIIQRRCLDNGGTAADCEHRAAIARQHHVEVAGIGGWRSVPGTTVEDWLDSGQARDVFLPAFNYRPKKSVQYSLALRNFDGPGKPLAFEWGFIASSDTHFARAGNGFKQSPRIGTGDAGMRGARNSFWDWLLYSRQKEEPADHSRSVLQITGDLSEQERKMSFLTAGGVVAVHAEGRNRASIWEALQRREVYGTSGHRLLLWFDLLNAGDGIKPMGSKASMQEPPRFRVTAVGSFKQLPGCPEYVQQALSKKRLQYLAEEECYHPSDERYLVDRIEVVRIRPQTYASEPVQDLIEDPWRVFECEPDPAGCTIEFSDSTGDADGRDAVYYVRAIEEPSPTINGNNLRAVRDDAGNVMSVDPCWGDFRIGRDDDCHALKGQRAWSSPIFVSIAGGAELP